jgi:hypothetical protein
MEERDLVRYEIVFKRDLHADGLIALHYLNYLVGMSPADVANPKRLLIAAKRSMIELLHALISMQMKLSDSRLEGRWKFLLRSVSRPRHEIVEEIFRLLANIKSASIQPN